MVKKELLDELKEILERKFKAKLTDEQVALIRNSLADYFTLLKYIYLENSDEIVKEIEVVELKERLNLKKKTNSK